MFAVLPTGCGKSLIFQIVPKVCSYLHDRGFSYPKAAIVVVICPLYALIDSHILELKEPGIPACSLADDDLLEDDVGRDPLNQNSNRSDREKRTTSKGGPVFSKLFRLDRTDPLSFGPKFPEILVEWIAPVASHSIVFTGPELIVREEKWRKVLQSKTFLLLLKRLLSC